MTASDLDLLGQFTRDQSQDAFTALVKRHLDLVYTAALRQVQLPQLAEEVAQSVFASLARDAAKLEPNTVLTAWLYQVTRHAAIDVVRRESRRQAREQIAFQMSDANDTSAGWSRIEPLLDEAMQSLDDADRTAILLRFFENKSLREVGEALGASEDAAQKRVHRAVERLRGFLAEHDVTVGAGGLAALLSANAIQAAPAGLAAAIASGAVVSTAALSGSTAVTLAQTLAMTAIQKTIVTAVITAAIGLGVYQTIRVSSLRDQVNTLGEQQAKHSALASQVEALTRERDQATNRLAALVAENATLRKNPNEVLRLRGEVGRLRDENASIGSSNAISKVTANPEARKMLRTQQKMGMGIIYKGLATQLKLTAEQSDQLNDLLADHIMENVDHVTVALRDKLTPEQINELFVAQDASLQERALALLGQDGMGQFQDYSKSLLSRLSAEQFKPMLAGNDAAKDEKATQFRQVLQEEVQSALANAGLPADYQTVPILNFRNIASESDAERNLKLLDAIYQKTAERARVFLTEEEITKLQEFRTTAINNNRSLLTLNRTMMAPIAQ